MENPFEPTICDGFLVGRGSCDNKGGLAAMLHALARVQASGRKPPCEILLAATVDEEFSFGGVQALCKSLEADAAVVAEPTELRVTTACKGCLRWRVVVQGKEAHSAKPHLGTNAIVHMAEVIRAIDQDSQRLESRSHPLLGSATCSIGLIQGGTQVNVVPDLATIEIDRRLLPGEDVDDVLSHYAGILDQLKTSLHGLTCHMEPPTVLTTPVETPAHLPLVERAGEILRDMDLHSELVGVPFSCDASTLAQHGVPSIIFGPGSIDQAHTPHEFVELAQVEQAEDFYYRMMMSDLAGGD